MIRREHGRAAPAEELTRELIGRRPDALETLPRTVFLLRHVDGQDHAAIGDRRSAIGDRLGIGIEAVERQLERAMRLLVFGADEGRR